MKMISFKLNLYHLVVNIYRILELIQVANILLPKYWQHTRSQEYQPGGSLRMTIFYGRALQQPA